MNLNLHKEEIPKQKACYFKQKKEDDYMQFDPITKQPIVSPLKFLDDKTQIQDVEHGLYVLQEEFIMNH